MWQLLQEKNTLPEDHFVYYAVTVRKYRTIVAVALPHPCPSPNLGDTLCPCSGDKFCARGQGSLEIPWTYILEGGNKLVECAQSVIRSYIHTAKILSTSFPRSWL